VSAGAGFGHVQKIVQVFEFLAERGDLLALVGDGRPIITSFSTSNTRIVFFAFAGGWGLL